MLDVQRKETLSLIGTELQALSTALSNKVQYLEVYI
jgi:hypothetical protein